MIVHLAPIEAAARVAAGALYLDVRTPEEFEEGHAEGAWNLPVKLRSSTRGLVDNPRFRELAAKLVDPHRELVVGCKSGPRSELAATWLAGRPGSIAVVVGGFEGRRDAFGTLEAPGWKQSELPVSYDPSSSYEALLARLGDKAE